MNAQINRAINSSMKDRGFPKIQHASNLQTSATLSLSGKNSQEFSAYLVIMDDKSMGKVMNGYNWLKNIYIFTFVALEFKSFDLK